MYWFHFNSCLIVVALLTPNIVSAENTSSGKTNFNTDSEALPTEQTLDHNDVSMMEPVQPARRFLRQPVMANFNGNMVGNTGFQFPQGLVQAPPHVAQPEDAQESSASNKVVLVLDNDKNKHAEAIQPNQEESLQRLTRNPDAIDDLLGQFQQLSGGMTQQLLQQFSQTAPEISKSFGQALNEVLTQTNLLAQAAPANLNFSQMKDNFGQPILPGSVDLGQLGHNFFVGATQNLFKPFGSRDASGGALGSESSTAPGAESETAEEAANTSEVPKNPFVGQPLFPRFAQLNPLNPFGMFAPFSALRPLIPSGSEISEVRVLPEQYSPYKVSPKQVDHPSMAEMRLKAVLKEALNKKTIPILWFHLPTNHKLQQTREDVEMETKLQMFEQQVIAELKQLQELARMAEEMKRAQLQSGAQPTTSLTTKLNLFEIPIYDITLGDIEKTLKDEYVMRLMQTLVQKQNKEFQRHHQATTKYLTDLTGTPIKRHVKTTEDLFQTMEKDDMMKMMSYAYRMASMNGHEMPWLKNKNMTIVDKQKTTKLSGTEEQQIKDAQMNDENKWLEDKRRQITFETEKQRQMLADKQQIMVQSPIRYWTDPAVMQHQMQVQRGMMQPQIQRQMASQRQMVPSQLQSEMPVESQTKPPQMPQPMQSDGQMKLPPIHEQMMPSQMQTEMPVESETKPPQMQQPMQSDGQIKLSPIHEQMMPSPMESEIPVDCRTKLPQRQQPMRSDGQMMLPPMHEQLMPSPIESEMSVESQTKPPQMHQPMQSDGQMMRPPMHEQMMPSPVESEMPVESQTNPPQMQQPIQSEGQTMRPPIHEQMIVQRRMVPTQMLPEMPAERQMMHPQMMLPQMQEQMAAERQMMPPQMTIHRQFEQQMPVGRQMMPLQMGTERRIVSPQMQQQIPAEMQMMPPQLLDQIPVPHHVFGFETPMLHNKMLDTNKNFIQDPMRQLMHLEDIPNQIMQNDPLNQWLQQQDISSQIMQQQYTPRSMMQPQPMMTNFEMEEPILMQRQQEQPMMKMQRTEPNLLQFERNSVNTNMPEIKSNTEQNAEPKKLVETTIPNRPIGSNAEKMPITKPTATMENTDQLPKQEQKIDVNGSETQPKKDLGMDSMSAVPEAKPQMPENEGKARFKGAEHLFDNLGFSNNHLGKGTVTPSAVYNYYYNNGGSRYPLPYGPSHSTQHIYTHVAPNYHNQRPPVPLPHPRLTHLHYQPANTHYSQVSSNGGYRSATGDEEIAIMLQQHQQQEHPKPVTFFRK